MENTDKISFFSSDEPPFWTQAPFLILAQILMLLAAELLLLGPFLNLVRHIPMEWQLKSIPGLVFLFGVAWFTPSIIIGRMARWRTYRKLRPGDVWYDRAMAIAQKMDVPIQEVVEVWDQKPCASASLTGGINLACGLIHNLQPEEVDAIVAHEIGLHRGRDFQKRFLLPFAAILVAICFSLGLSYYLEGHVRLSPEIRMIFRSNALSYILVGFIVMSQIVRDCRRQRERELSADRFAVDATQNPELVVRALTKVHALSGLPPRKPGEKYPQPSLEERVAAIHDYAPERSVRQ